MNPIKKTYRWTQTSARNALAAIGMSGLAAFLGLSLMIGAATAAPPSVSATTPGGETTQTTQSAPQQRSGGWGMGPIIFLPSWGWGWNAPRVPAPAPVEGPVSRPAPAPNAGPASAPVGGGSSDSRSWSGPSNSKPSQAAPKPGGSDIRSWGGGTTRSAPAPRPSLPKIRARR